MCENGKNQTSEDVFKFFERKLSNKYTRTQMETILGTGVYLVPDPERGILEHKRVYAKQISYHEAVKRGANCVAFKFVPEELMSLDQIKAFICGQDCTVRCPDPCICFFDERLCIE